MEDPFRTEALRREAEALRRSGALGHSTPLIGTFDFLTEASLAGRAVKESELAHAVFRRPGDQAAPDDATVRVYMHRLRKRLDDYYARHGDEAGRLVIPKGEYRLVFAAPDAATGPVSAMSPNSARPAEGTARQRRRLWLAGVLGLALVALLGAVGLAAARDGDELATVRAGPLWRALVVSPRPTSLVAGDLYLFGDSPDRVAVSRLIRDPAINSRQDLDAVVMANPDLIGHHVDVGAHVMPIGAAPVLQRILPIVTLTRSDWPTPRTLAMSETTPDRLKLSNIVYVGLIGGVGPLRGPLERGGTAFATLYRDAQTARRAGDAPAADVAYLTAFPGPFGNRVVVIAGLRDAGLVQAGEIAANPQMVETLTRRVGDADAWEAVFRVTSLDTTNLGSQLIAARPFRAGPLWVGPARR